MIGAIDPEPGNSGPSTGDEHDARRNAARVATKHRVFMLGSDGIRIAGKPATAVIVGYPN
jgi:hypothetical protein